MIDLNLIFKASATAPIDNEKNFLKSIIADSSSTLSKTFGCLADLVVICENDFVYISETAQKNILDYSKEKLTPVSKVLGLIKKSSNTVFEEGEIRGVFLPSPLSKDFDLKTIAMSFHIVNNSKHLSPKEVLLEELTTFYHEVGHIVCEEGHKFSNPVSEAAADVFAALMRTKQLGHDANFTDNEIKRNGSTPVFAENLEEASYYTSIPLFVAERFLKEATIEDWSPQDLAWFSKNIALKYHTKETTLEKISNAYSSARWLHSNGLHNYSKEIIAKTMLLYKGDEDIYRAGKLSLSYLGTNPSLLKGVFWNKTLSEMDKHEKEAGFILNPLQSKDVDFIKDLLKFRKTQNTKPCSKNNKM